MIFSNDMIKNILEEHLWPKDIFQDGKFQCGFDELVEGITIELNLMADIEDQLRQLKDEEQMLKEEHVNALDDIEAARQNTKDQCRHHSTTHLENQPGGSTICDMCDEEVG